MKGCYKALKTRLINMKNGKKAPSLETTYGDSFIFLFLKMDIKDFNRFFTTFIPNKPFPKLFNISS